jgi:hypothetical protein
MTTENIGDIVISPNSRLKSAWKARSRRSRLEFVKLLVIQEILIK